MNIHLFNRLLFAVLVSVSFAGFSSTASAQEQSKHKDMQEKIDAQADKDKYKDSRAQKKSDHPQAQPEQTKGSQRIMQASKSPKSDNEQLKAMQTQEPRQKQEREREVVKQHVDRQDDKRRDEYKNEKAAKKSPSQNVVQQRRLPEQQQRVLIQQQQQRVTQYRKNVAQRQTSSRQHGMQLQQQKRMSQYRYQQEYYERMRQQQIRYQNERYDYNNDPYFYTASSYRYNRGGRYYQTNQYGANILRQALNYGYQEGMYAGRADRQDSWRYSYRDSYIYQDANYGYNGYYVQQDDYNYYFRQGFQRGYEDGYYGRRQYGRNNNGSDSLLSAVLIAVLGLQSIR